MNLEELEKHILTVKAFDWCGKTVYLRKLNADDHIALFGKITSPEDAVSDKEATAQFHVELVARALATEAGELTADSDNGRAVLRRIGYDDLVALGKLVLEHNGYGEKKSTAEPNSSPSASAETLDPRSSTPDTSCLS